MIISLDVDYRDNTAVTGGIAFEDWPNASPNAQYTCTTDNVAPYEPGAFYKRELPCLLKLLQDHRLTPKIVVIDGFVYLDGHSKPGLGRHLFDALNQKIPVIGVAKKAFKGIDENCAIYRGKSTKPLYVTAAGMDLDQAQRHILTMHGKYREPTLLKLADRLCREGEAQALP